MSDLESFPMTDIKIDQMTDESWADVALIYESGIATKKCNLSN